MSSEYQERFTNWVCDHESDLQKRFLETKPLDYISSDQWTQSEEQEFWDWCQELYDDLSPEREDKENR